MSLVEAPAPTKPFYVTTMKSFQPVGELPNYDIQVADVHEFFAAKVHVKNCMGNYHPHGDLAIYGSLVNIANYASSYIDKLGNWGNVTGDPPAAQRYTECRLSKLANQVLFDSYNMYTVEKIPNYDGSKLEPVVLVPAIPMVFVHGQTSGIAVTMTSEIPAFTIESVAKLTRALMNRSLRNKKFTPTTATDCERVLKFRHHTGGLVVSTTEEVLDFFKGEQSTIRWSADFTWSDTKKGRCCSVTGFPPKWNYENKVQSIIALDGVREVTPYNDKKTNETVLCIYLKKGTVAEMDAAADKVERKLLSQVAYKFNYVERYAVEHDAQTEVKEVRARPLQMTIPELFDRWIKWRVAERKKALLTDLERLKAKLAKEILLLNAIKFFDEMADMLRKRGKYANKTFDKVDTLATLMSITREESEEIWAISIGRFDTITQEAQVTKIQGLKVQINVVTGKVQKVFTDTYEYIRETTTKLATR